MTCDGVIAGGRGLHFHKDSSLLGPHIGGWMFPADATPDTWGRRTTHSSGQNQPKVGSV